MLSEIINQFKENIQGLRDFVDLVEPFLNKKEKDLIMNERENLLPLMAAFSHLDEKFKMTPEISEKVQNKVGKIKTEVIEEGENQSINVSFEKSDDGFSKAIWMMRKSNLQKEHLYKSSLISLTSTAEQFMYQLFHKYYDLFPFPAEHKEKFFSLEDLKNFGNIDDAKNFLISCKVDKIMRQGFEEWFHSLKKPEVISLKMNQVQKYREELTEIFQRRHLLVHNGGIVNEFYFQKVHEQYRQKIKKGEKIPIIKEYVDDAIDTIEFCFLLIAFELWQKIDKQNIEKRSETINQFILDYIDIEKYQYAEELSIFFCSEKDLKEHYKLVGQLNYWQSIKWQGRYEEIRAEVEKADYTVKDALFKAGYYAIREENKEFFIYLEEALKNSKLRSTDARTWPIFKEIRKEKKFETIVRKYE